MPKSSSAMWTPSRASCGELVGQRGAGGDEGGLGDLEVQPLRREAGRLEHRCTTSAAKPVRASWLGETLTATQPPGARPSASSAASRQAWASIQRPSGRMSPLLSASSRKRSGGSSPLVGVLPAHERLVADDRQAAERRRSAGSGRAARPSRATRAGRPRAAGPRGCRCGRAPGRRRRSGPGRAAWRAAAPCRRASRTSSAVSGWVPMLPPTLSVTACRWPPRSNGSSSASASRDAVSASSAGVRTPSTTTTNSSPPTRPSRSSGRSAAAQPLGDLAAAGCRPPRARGCR